MSVLFSFLERDLTLAKRRRLTFRASQSLQPFSVHPHRYGLTMDWPTRCPWRSAETFREIRIGWRWNHHMTPLWYSNILWVWWFHMPHLCPCGYLVWLTFMPGIQGIYVARGALAARSDSERWTTWSSQPASDPEFPNSCREQISLFRSDVQRFDGITLKSWEVEDAQRGLSVPVAYLGFHKRAKSFLATSAYTKGVKPTLKKLYIYACMCMSFFKIGLVLMVFRLIGSHLISHLALRQSQSMIPSLHSLLSPVVYPKVPYLAHSFLLYMLFLLARWSQKIPSNTISTLMTPSCTSLSLL